MRRDARTDANHAEIRMALRAAGYSCYDLFRLGQGWPDILVLSKTGIPILGEIKSDEGRLTPAEKYFHSNYHGPLEVWRSAEQALDRMYVWDQRIMKNKEVDQCQR